MDSSDEDDEQEQKKERKTKISRKRKEMNGGVGVAHSRGRAWIKESSGDDPVNFLDPGVIQKVVGMWGQAY